MPKREEINKVLLIGSGPIQIGQAAEFDYSGSQACRSLREEGVEVVLVNSNPATIMTDPDMADSVYVEPLNSKVLTEIIEKEKPDGIAAGLGGQTGLNLTAELAELGVLEKYDVEVLGTPIETISDSEDRARFKDFMNNIGEQVPRSVPVGSIEEAKKAAESIGFPVIIRPAYTLGGSGGGAAQDMDELEEIAQRGLTLSRIDQVLIEESVIGWKEFEYEVMRDSTDTCITVVNMENFDPMGIHTGESIVFAPSQTLSDNDHQMLRSAAIRIIRALGVEGGCNIQFAFNSETGEYKVVEVNPRVSRSSALASKATGYPIARVAAKIAVGMNLEEIPNDVTKRTPASFEPTVDYVVTKIPKWPFEKFHGVDTALTTQMKSTGEAMAIGRTLEESFQKAIRSLDGPTSTLREGAADHFSDVKDIEDYLTTPTDLRKFAIYEGLKSGMSVEEVAELTQIDPFWLQKIENIIEMENSLAQDWKTNLEKAKKYGFTDTQIAELADVELDQVEAFRREQTNIDYKMVDTCAAEFEAETPYYYSTFERGSSVTEEGTAEESVEYGKDREKVLIVGAGPIRIGQGIEFDYCCVHAVDALREENIESVMINNNPETVSTDYDTADKLFFDPLTLEDVLNVIEQERPDGVMIQFGGQTSVNLALPLYQKLQQRDDLETEIYGTHPENMDLAEDREHFSNLLTELNITQPSSDMASTEEEAIKVARSINYPLLVRPSYVLGGRAMEIVYDESELKEYIEEAVKVGPNQPVLIDEFIEGGVEIDVDAVSDGEDVLIGGIMEHIEEAGVHSGDSACVLPPQSIEESIQDRIREYVEKLCDALNVVGLINIQMAVRDGEVYLLEANPRSSRTIPYVSKATGQQLAKIATKVMVGRSLSELGCLDTAEPDYVSVKEVVFPFSKFPGVDPLLGPEMRSTGEVMGIDDDFGNAFYKAEIAAKNELPLEGRVFISVKDSDKESILPLARELESFGFDLLATSGTAKYLGDRGLKVEAVRKVSEGSPNIVEEMKEGDISLIINTPTRGRQPHRDGYKIRRAAIDHEIPYITSIEFAEAAVDAIDHVVEGDISIKSLTDYQSAP